MSNPELHNDFEALCAGYVLGALSPEEAKEFESMLSNASAEHKHLFLQMQQVRDELALASERAEPSPGVEEKLISEISSLSHKSGDDHINQQKSRIIPLWIYQAAAAVFLIGALTLAYFNAGLSDTVEQQQAVITELQDELDRQDQLLNVLAAREITLVIMGGLDPSPEGYGKIIWDPENRQAVLQLANLPVPPQDKDYQLWLIKDGENPISAGVFNFDQPSTDLFFKVEHLDEEPSPVSNAFAVTMEPRGGMPQPTGDMFLIGQQ